MFDLSSRVWSTESIPVGWLSDIIFPLAKSGDNRVIDNYRGITLKCLPQRVYDKVMTARLSSWLTENCFVHPNQAGYQVGMRTLDWIFIMREIMFSHIKSKSPLYVCFFD